VVVASQIATVDKSRLLEKIGSLSNAMAKAVSDGCQMSISLRIF
jgi:mRNA-degrading endonuclease toxin of MazEF toxin-antitoxin module